MKIYALVDACNANGILDAIEKYCPQYACLFNPPLQDGMAERSPYLVEINEGIKLWLAELKTPWGLYLISEECFMEMRRHLRQYTYAKIPIEEKPVFFRFYDPRVFWKLVGILDDKQLHAFLGPIAIVATSYDGYRQDHFGDRRNQFSTGLKMKDMFLIFSESQYERFDAMYQEDYIKELSAHMMKHIDPKIIEEIKQNEKDIHREILEHERDVKGAEISHSADQSFLLDKDKVVMQSRVEQAYFEFSRSTGQWDKIRGEKVEKAEPLIGLALNKIAKTPISEAEFHEKTDYQYVKNNIKDDDRSLVPVPDYLKEYGNEPYFYQQNGQWFYVNSDKTAYPIKDERIDALKFLNKEKIFEDDFHRRTKNRYEVYRGLAYLPEIKQEEDVFRVTSMEDLQRIIDRFAKDLYLLCCAWNVIDDRTIKAFSILLVKFGIYAISDIPNKWVEEINDYNYESFFNIERLVINELGYLP